MERQKEHLKREPFKVTHGLTKTSLYRRWQSMRQRCFNPNEPAYEHYGARGITVCPEWREFEPFRDWALSHGYRPDLQLDRKDNNGNYTPENCRFITQLENCRNTRRVKMTLEKAAQLRLIYSIGLFTQKELADLFGIKKTLAGYIILKKRWMK